jgi:hypothetical protein
LTELAPFWQVLQIIAVVNSPSRGPKKLPNGLWQHNYGVTAAVRLANWQVELLCWRERWDSGLNPIEHLRRALAILQPESIWHPWRARRFDSLCNDAMASKIGTTTIRNISWVGPGAGGKTNDAGVFAFYFWLLDPANTSIALTSTSKQKMRQRVWPLIQECWRAAKVAMMDLGDCEPHMLNSTMELQAIKGDSKHAIFGQAVEQGEIGPAVERLKGVHCSRIMLVIDEAPGTPEAIFQTIPNMAKGCQELIVLTIGNGPMTHFDCFSRCCRPVGGWKSIGVESDQWETASVPEFQLPRGTCLHFDGAKSPNVEAGRTLYPFLYSWEDWQRSMRDPLIQRTAGFYSQDRGFWPPEGFLRTVLTEEMIELGNARGEVTFAGPTTSIGSIDTGFGGDACVLRFGRLGHVASGKLAVQIDERFVVPILVDAVDENGKRLPAEYQIANFVKPLCDARKVKPHCFGVEATGTGRGAAAVLLQQFGEIVWVESGGKPSDMPASEEDNRPSHQVYDRRVTELWFSVAAFVKGSQLGGLTEDDCTQFCARQYDYVSKKYILEKKEDLKPRLGRSPDDADSVAVMIEVARQMGMHTRGPRGDRMLGQFDGVITLNQEVIREANLYQPEQAP